VSTDLHSAKTNYHWRPIAANVEGIFSAQKKFSIQLTKAGRKKICLINTNQKWYAIQPFCPHAGGPFADGWCENKKITCPYHRYVFDLESGRCVNGEPFYIKTYPVLIKDKNIYVGFKLSRFRSWLNRLAPNKDKSNNLA
jgi:nitrite reductase/ring-hydroxylating ferredoxin subunit